MVVIKTTNQLSYVESYPLYWNIDIAVLEVSIFQIVTELLYLTLFVLDTPEALWCFRAYSFSRSQVAQAPDSVTNLISNQRERHLGESFPYNGRLLHTGVNVAIIDVEWELGIKGMVIN